MSNFFWPLKDFDYIKTYGFILNKPLPIRKLIVFTVVVFALDNKSCLENLFLKAHQNPNYAISLSWISVTIVYLFLATSSLQSESETCVPICKSASNLFTVIFWSLPNWNKFILSTWNSKDKNFNGNIYFQRTLCARFVSQNNSHSTWYGKRPH